MLLYLRVCFVSFVFYFICLYVFHLSLCLFVFCLSVFVLVGEVLGSEVTGH